MKKLFPFIIAILLISSCAEEKKDAVISHSPNGNITLTISGKRDSKVSPWTIDMVASGKGLKGNVGFDFYGSDVSDKTISVVWESNKKCTITFTEKDNNQRIYLFTPESMDAMWTDLSPKK